MQSKLYEPCDKGEFDGSYSVKGYGAVAWEVWGWELEPLAVFSCVNCAYIRVEREHGGGRVECRGNLECEHEIYPGDELQYERTGNIIAHMFGDDKEWTLDPSDLTLIDEDDFCHECGQM